MAAEQIDEIEVVVADSKSIAGLLGPTLVAISISEAVNLPVLTDPPDASGLVYLNGTLLFVAGLAIIRAHNHWILGWPLLVTSVGWFFAVGGLGRMFLPESTQSGDAWVYALCIVLLAIGMILTFKAYWPRS